MDPRDAPEQKPRIKRPIKDRFSSSSSCDINFTFNGRLHIFNLASSRLLLFSSIELFARGLLVAVDAQCVAEKSQF